METKPTHATHHVQQQSTLEEALRSTDELLARHDFVDLMDDFLDVNEICSLLEQP